MKKIVLVLISLFVFFSCDRSNPTQEIGKRYFEIYSKRKELDKISSFYADEFQYENVAIEIETNDHKFLFDHLYGWNDPNFQFEQPESIEIERIISNDSTIIGIGSTLPYTYNGNKDEGSRFVIILELDKNKKIKKQTDWFDYPMHEIVEAFYLKQNMKIE